MKPKLLSATLALWGIVFPLYAYRWPNDNAQIIRHFGQNTKVGLSRSLDVSGEFEEVFPVKEGMIVFEHGEDEELFPTKSAQTVIMGNNDGINVVYSGLSEIKAKPLEVLSEHQVLGLHDIKDTLSIAFYDYQVSQYVNPLLFLPERVFQSHSISLGTMYLKAQDGTEIPVVHNMTLSAGTYEVFAHVQENIDGEILAPYQVEIDFMGDIIAQITMDALTASEGKGVLKGKKVYAESLLYDEKGRFRLGKLTLIPGQAFVTIRLSSINGLRRQEQFRIISTKKLGNLN